MQKAIKQLKRGGEMRAFDKLASARGLIACASACAALVFSAENPAWAQAQSQARLTDGQSAASANAVSGNGWIAAERGKWAQREATRVDAGPLPTGRAAGSPVDGFKKMIDESRAQEEAARHGLSAASLGGLLSPQSAGALTEIATQTLGGVAGIDSNRRALIAKNEVYTTEDGSGYSSQDENDNQAFEAARAQKSGKNSMAPPASAAGVGKAHSGAFALSGDMQALAERVIIEKKLDPSHAQALRKAIAGARFASQGVPGAAHHPMTPDECKSADLDTGKLKGGESDRAVCGAPWMAKVPGSNVCIDRFEYPNLPCQYPVTWVQARDAAQICEAEGKRLCDAREWEGACAAKPMPEEWSQSRDAHNASREKIWPTGEERDPTACAMGVPKSAACNAAIAANKGVREACGANTWPSGSFPGCGGPLGVYDQQGNAAEHMNLPRNASEQGANGGHGVTEMKGAWFAFTRTSTQVHPDDCEWREPGWHRTSLLDLRSHANYHLGFRCCRDLSGSAGDHPEPIQGE